MALAATTNYEVRTTGSATNGGGFNPSRDAVNGVDYSQQDAAQLALTNGYFTSGTTFKSDTGGFTHAMEGNIVYIVSGTHFTAGWYEIVSYVDTNTVTLDRAPASEDTSAHKDAVFNVGGALDHPNTISTVLVAGNTVYIQNGTYVKVGANAYVFTLTVAGTAGAPIRWVGYVTNHSTIPTGTDRPLISGGGNTTNCISITVSANTFENLVFYNATGDNTIVSTGATGSLFRNCRSYGSGGDGAYIEIDGFYYDCEFDTNSQEGLNDAYGGTGVIVGCYAHDNTDGGFSLDVASGHITYITCIADSNTGVGIASNGATSNFGAFNCLAYNNTGATSDGFLIDNANLNYDNTILLNNSSSDNGRYGFSSEQAVTAYNYVFDFNNYNGNGTAGLNNITAGANDNTNDPSFVDAANGNFRLNSNDTALLNMGYPGTTIGGGGALV